MRVLGPLLLLSLLTGCVSPAHKWALIEERSPASTPTSHVVEITAPTGHWIGGFDGTYEQAREYSFYLPEAAGDHDKFQSDQITVFETRIDSDSKIPVSVDSGYVEIDREKKRVIVELHTPSGDFWANGIYPLH